MSIVVLCCGFISNKYVTNVPITGDNCRKESNLQICLDDNTMTVENQTVQIVKLGGTCQCNPREDVKIKLMRKYILVAKKGDPIVKGAKYKIEANKDFRKAYRKLRSTSPAVLTMKALQ